MIWKCLQIKYVILHSIKRYDDLSTIVKSYTILPNNRK